MLFYVVLALILLVYAFYPKSKWGGAVFLFVLFITMRRLLGPEDQLLGMLDQRLIVSILVIFTVYNSKVPGLKVGFLDKSKKYAIYLSIFSLIILIRYIDIKAGLINGDINWLSQIKTIIRDIIFIYALILIINRMYIPETFQALENGLFFGIALIVFSIIFYQIFESIGLYSIGERETELLLQKNFARLTGFRGGNPNGAAAQFNLVLAYALSKIQSTRKFTLKYKLLIVAHLIGILLFASKTGLSVAIILVLFFIFKSWNNIKSPLGVTFAIVLLGIIGYNYFGDIMEYRIERQISGEFDTAGSRFQHWRDYSDYFSEHGETFIFGYIEQTSLKQDVHNTYIGVIYDAGIISFIIIFIMLRKMYVNRKTNDKYAFDLTYLFLALLLHWVTGSIFFNYWFFLIAAASTGIPPILKQRKLIHY